MDDINSILIMVLWAIVFIAFAWWLFFGPKGLMQVAWKKKIHALEVEVRMHGDLEAISELRQIAKLYERMGKNWEAEKYYCRAISICESELGKSDPRLLPVLKDYISLLEKMNYRKKADEVREKIKLIGKYKP